MPIQILSSSVVNKIAAGEVIERPANVIKELLENALDAHADEIAIEIQAAGLEKIKVSDNGNGMEREDLLLSWKRHATSKIQDETDLDHISSLGFRGEALSSIAEISNLKIKTKTKENEVGYLLHIEGGIELENQKIGCPDGTSIEISNLFYNVPARKKFLKSPEVELAHIIDIVTRYALIKKEIAITLKHNEKEILNSQKTQSWHNNIIYIYGTEITKNLIEVDHKENNIHVTGYISKPNLTRANKNEQSIYVNERFIKSQIISDAIYEGYKTLLFHNRHPVCILNIKTEPQNCDVNIHPNKLDIRFKNEAAVKQAVTHAVQQALENQILIPTADIPLATSERKPIVKIYEQKKTTQSNLFSQEQSAKPTPQTTYQYPEIKPHNVFSVQDKAVTEKTSPFADFMVLGQVNKTFILCESKLGAAIIDQHAAEERVNYERFIRELKEGALQKQSLLHGEIIELSPIQMQTAIAQKQFLEKIGFNYDEFGGSAIKLNTIPEIFGRLKQNLFLDILNELLKINTKIIEQEIEDRIIRFACRASIKAGDELSMSEMTTLLNRLGKCNNPYTCPHGRPTVVQLSIADLEKMFKRTG